MLSAAEDIISKKEGDPQTECEPEIVVRNCKFISTGAVLLADIIPSLIVKATFPFFMHRIPFGYLNCLRNFR